MSEPTAKSDITIMRRERVASLLLRGLSQREITATLGNPGTPDKPNSGYIVNPNTNEPYDLATINRDIQVLRKQHREAALVSMDEHQSRQYAELQELKRFAWAKQNGLLALKAIETEMKLVGTYKSGVNIVFNIELVTQVWNLMEQKGMNASEIFNSMLLELSDGNTTVVQP